jgi:hypothetical protein
MDLQHWFLSCVLSLCQCLEGLKAHAKLVSLGESMDSSLNIQSDKVELCRYAPKKLDFYKKRAHQSKGGREERKGDFITSEVPIFYFSS